MRHFVSWDITMWLSNFSIQLTRYEYSVGLHSQTFTVYYTYYAYIVCIFCTSIPITVIHAVVVCKSCLSITYMTKESSIVVLRKSTYWWNTLEVQGWALF